MNSEYVVTVLVALVAGGGASIITGLFSMPKLRSEAQSAKVDGHVAISGDAREWASKFAERADRAEQRADKAEERADEAERHADQLDIRIDELEAKQLKLANYTRLLQRQMRDHGWVVPEPPSDLSPPL